MGKHCHCAFSRRQFLQMTGGALACSALQPLAARAAAARAAAAGINTTTPIFPKSRARVGLVFSHVPTGHATWPTKDYDYGKRAAELTASLKKLCPRVDFDIHTAHNAAEADAIIAATGDVDGYLVYAIGIWTRVPDRVMRSGKPVVLADDLFAGSGEVLISSGVARREKLPVVVVSSSEIADVARAADLFAALRAMKDSRILDVVDRDIADPAAKIKDLYGAEVLKLDSKELAGYFDRASVSEAETWASRWSRGAKKVVEPSREDLVNSGRMYLALAEAVAARRCDAATVDCLGMFYSGRVTAYPCLAFFQMNNDGSTGVCEGDLNSTCTQLLMRHITGRPGYVSDPVIDTAKGEIIYAHCVAHNRAFGPGGRTNPYVIRSHAEDGRGASVQSLLPAGETVTTLEIDVWSKRMVIHTAKTTGNVDESKACRTKLAAKTEARAILDNWDMGWHRVTFYGDYRETAINAARLLGLAVSEEDRAAG